MREYNEIELNHKIDAFLTRKLSARFGSSLRFKATYFDRTKAVAALLLHPHKSGTDTKSILFLKGRGLGRSASSHYLSI